MLRKTPSEPLLKPRWPCLNSKVSGVLAIRIADKILLTRSPTLIGLWSDGAIALSDFGIKNIVDLLEDFGILAFSIKAFNNSVIGSRPDEQNLDLFTLSGPGVVLLLILSNASLTSSFVISIHNSL